MKKSRLLTIFIVFGLLLMGCDILKNPEEVEEPIKESEAEPPQSEEISTENESETSEEETDTDPEPDTADEIQEIADKPLSDDGSWWIFSTPDGLFALNPDGSGLTQFYFGLVNSPWSREIIASPGGGHLAYLVGESYDARLKITEFPSLEQIADLPLITYHNDQDMDAMRAIVEQPSMAFSPDGRYLAFMGVIDGPSSDLYLYSLENDDVTRLTDGPAQAYQPVWSPDGKYIVHTGVSTFGSGAGLSMTGVWASDIDTTDAVSLYDPSGSGSERILGWVDDQIFVVYSWNPMCGMNNVRTFNIETKESVILWAESFRAIAYDPINKVALLSSNDGTCAPESGVGLYAVPTNGNGAFRFLEFAGPQVTWSEDAKLFLVSSDLGSGVIAADSNGQFIDLDMPQGAQVFPAVAPGSRDLAWSGESLWVGPLLGSIDFPPEAIFNEPVYTVTWTPDGGSVIFFAESGLHIAHKPDYTPVLISGGQDNQNGYSGWLYP